MGRIEPGMRVKNRHDQLGVTVSDGPYGVCADWETPVVYDGLSYSVGTPTESIEIIGPENAVPNPHKCGAGREADCCIFLTAGADGFICERHTSLRTSLIFKDMVSKRHPTEPYPECMKFPNQAKAAE